MIKILIQTGSQTIQQLKVFMDFLSFFQNRFYVTLQKKNEQEDQFDKRSLEDYFFRVFEPSSTLLIVNLFA